MILRGVMAYDPEKNSWQGPGSKCSIKLDILKQVRGINVYEEHKRYNQSFKACWRSSDPIMLLLGAITLFTPRPNVVHKDLIEKQRKIYFHLLNKYLRSIYPTATECEGEFRELVQKIDDLHSLNDNAVRIFLDVNPKDVEPLLIEIFDLK